MDKLMQQEDDWYFQKLVMEFQNTKRRQIKTARTQYESEVNLLKQKELQRERSLKILLREIEDMKKK